MRTPISYHNNIIISRTPINYHNNSKEAIIMTMKMNISLAWLLLLMVGLGAETAGAQQCPLLTEGDILSLTLLSSSLATSSVRQSQANSEEANCFIVPGTSSDKYRLTIRNYVYGRFSIYDATGSGYAWNPNADGIYYCTQGGKTITFEEFPETGATVTILAEKLEDSEECFSDFIGFDGILPVGTPGNTTEIYWSSHRYYLKAASFEYQVAGEDAPVTMANGKNIDIGGDPGDEEYSAIEVTWDIDGKEKRFYGYLSASPDDDSWKMFEARVYDNTQEWKEFYNPEGVNGSLEQCFKRDSLVISDGAGSEIRFQEVTLATFLPWENDVDFLNCIDGIVLDILGISSAVAVSSLQTSLAKTLNIQPLQIEFVQPVEDDSRRLRQRSLELSSRVQIAGRDHAQTSCLHRVISTAQVQDLLGQELGSSNITIELVASSGVVEDCSQDGPAEPTSSEASSEDVPPPEAPQTPPPTPPPPRDAVAKILGWHHWFTRMLMLGVFLLVNIV
jgi:hypothetical protein